MSPMTIEDDAARPDASAQEPAPATGHTRIGIADDNEETVTAEARERSPVIKGKTAVQPKRF